MRQPLVIDKERDDELSQRAKTASELSDNATIRSNVPIKPKKPKKPQNNDSSKKASAKELLRSLTDKNESIYQLNSKEKNNFTLGLNYYEKAALYIVSKKEGITKRSVIFKYPFNQIIKIAESAGMNSDVVEELAKDKKL